MIISYTTFVSIAHFSIDIAEDEEVFVTFSFSIRIVFLLSIRIFVFFLSNWNNDFFELSFWTKVDFCFFFFLIDLKSVRFSVAKQIG